MPVPANPSGTETGPHNLTRTYTDLQGRTMDGTATVKDTAPPYVSTTADVTDGRLRVSVPPGRYSVGAMLRDREGGRHYISEEITVA